MGGNYRRSRKTSLMTTTSHPAISTVRGEVTLKKLYELINDTVLPEINNINQRLNSMATKHEVDDLKKKVETLTSTVKLIQDVSLPKVVSDANNCRQGMVKLEHHSRRLNIIIKNCAEEVVLDEAGAEVPEDILAVVRKVFITDMGIPEADVDSWRLRDLHRLGKKTTARTKPRHIIVAFTQQANRNFVLSQAKQLKGKPITIMSDLPKELAQQRDKMLVKRRELLRSNIQAQVVERGYKPYLVMKQGTRWVDVNIDEFTIEQDVADT